MNDFPLWEMAQKYPEIREILRHKPPTKAPDYSKPMHDVAYLDANMDHWLEEDE